MIMGEEERELPFGEVEKSVGINAEVWGIKSSIGLSVPDRQNRPCGSCGTRRGRNWCFGTHSFFQTTTLTWCAKLAWEGRVRTPA